MEKLPPTSPKLDKRSTSPATSTPGQLQGVHHASSTEAIEDSPAKFRQSELSESDESAINDSMSVNNSTVPYEKPDDDTTIQETSPDDSCVAYRTRAKSSLSEPDTSIAFNLSSIVEHMKKEDIEKEISTDKEEEFVLKTPQSFPLDLWIGDQEEREKLMNSLTQIGESLDMEMKEQKDKKYIDWEKYLYLSEAVLDKSRKIVVPEDYLANTEEHKELKDMTITISKPVNDAQDSMYNALKIMAVVDLKKLPKENLENIIRLLIAICSDCFKKLGINNEVIAKMEKGLLELYATNEKLLAVEKCRMQLENDIQIEKNKYDDIRKEHEDLKAELIKFREYAHKKMQTELINNMNKEKDDLIERLNVATEKKEKYKERSYNLEVETKKQLEEQKQSKETITVKEVELKSLKEELKDLNEIHKELIKNYDDCKQETLDFADSNLELSGKVVNLQAECRKEREAVNDKINKIRTENKSEIEKAEIEIQRSKDSVKKQHKETMKMK